MNRIFKVIWSEARNAYVVVSELTKRQSKSCSTKKLLATLIAAGVFSMAGMHAPVTAAKIKEATRDNYIAIEATHFKEGDRLYINDGRKHVGDSVHINGYKYILTKIQISGDQDALYWVRDGYGLKVETDAKYFEGADTGLKVSPYKLKDSASTESTKGLVIRGLSGISDTKIKTAVNEDSLHLLSYDNYAGVSNSGGIETKRSYNYFILRNNEWEDVGLDVTPNGENFSKNFQEVNYNETTGYYEFNGKQVAFENVYNIDNKLGVFLTSPNGKEVYTGPVYGLHNEILITAYDEKSKTWSTVWGGEMSDPNSTIGSMTVGQFNNILADIHNEDAILADADVVKTVVNGTSSAINLQNKKGNLIPGITVTRTAIDGSDTVVTITEEENKNNKIDLVTGSRVSAEASNGNLTKLTINGVDYALSGVDTNTKYQITKKEKDSSTPANVVKTYNFNEIGSSGVGVDLIDTDTTYRVEDVTTSTPGAISAKKLVNNLGEEIDTFFDTDTKYTAGTGITIDSSKNNQISIIPSAVANSVSISYKANNETAKSVSLSDGLNFVQGGSVQISTGENGVVNISATDTNTYTTSASYDTSTKKATFSGTNGLSYNLDLSEITSGLGSMSSWTAKVGETTQSISNNDVLEFAGANGASISMENGVITISAIDTNTKYQITEKIKDSSTPANVVKTYNFNEIDSSGVGVDLVDTDTTYRVEDVTSSTPGVISTKKLVNNLGEEIGTFVDTDTDTKYTAGTGIRIDPSDNNKISIIPSEVANNVSISYKANGGSAKSVSLSQGLNFVQGGSVQISTGENGVVNISGTDTRNTTIAGKNIDVTYDADNLQYTVKTADDVVFTNVTANAATIGGIGISSTGITMNNQKITGLAAGVADTDAVNLGQLKEYAATAGANTKVLAGKNISVESNTDGGKNEYTVNLDNNVTLGSDSDDGSLLVKSSVGNVLISNGQIIGDKYAITNDGGAIFADGVISAAGDGTFRAANGNFTVFADGTVDSKLGDDGRFLATSGGLSVTKGSSNFVVTGAGVSLSAGKNALVVNADGTAIAGGLNVLGSKITNVAAGVDDTDAVNVGQLRDAVAAGDTHIKSGVYQVGEVSLEEGNKSQGVSIDVVDGSGSVTGKVKITDVAKASDLGDVSKLDADLKNSESNVTTVVDAVNNLNDKVGDLQYLNVAKGDIVNGDDTTTAIGKLNQALQNVSQKATAHNTVSNADTNITISESTNSDGGTNYALALNKEKINLGNVIIEGEKGSITAKNVTAGKTSIGDAGVQFDGKTYIGENGINANDQNITNVAAGELSETSKDAVNGSQLYATNQQVNQNTANINSLDNRISKLGSRVNKVGAGAAALAALHPMDFDPDDKLSFAVGMGNYAGENAAAIGAFYRPNEKVMMSIGGTYGNNENMVNVGLSFALDRTNNVSNSRTAMAHEIVELRAHVAKQDQQIAQLTALVNKLVGKDAVKGEGVLFPDVPENHWAYEYINGLVQAGVIEGYPDGTFGGERSLTRFEFATMLYKAMLKGTMMNNEIMKEFESEISRIRIDRISGKDNDANKIERVRVNYQNRDSYGTRIAK